MTEMSLHYSGSQYEQSQGAYTSFMNLRKKNPVEKGKEKGTNFSLKAESLKKYMRT